MCKENKTIIDNPQFRDSSSKLIFGDNILSCQFFRDYADMEILRNIQPEDIEDVSERYVPLYSTQRESDTVKKINISKYLPVKNENPLDLPLYIVSLIEHKTKVEYNVAMQMLRYMIHIWEDYEKQMEKEHSGISNMKDFRYPPILPIVYYEGKRTWTAPMDLSDRILCKDLLGKYLPHFQYQMVRLHDYSNEDLLKKGDEISLTMLINKIANLEDMEAFANLPDEQVNEILKDTPEYLLTIMERLARALFYNLSIPEDKTEEAVAKIKERKMARLFENVTFNYQAEIESMRNKTRQMEEDMKKQVEEKKQQMEEQSKIMQKEQEIFRQICKMSLKKCSDTEIEDFLIQNFCITREKAKEEIGKLYGD